MLNFSKAKRVLVAVLAAAFVPAAAVMAEEGVIEAMSSWQGRGQIYPTGPEEATFVGALSGVFYVKGDDTGMDASTMDAGLITCPVALTINTSDGSQSGKGKCVIVTPDSDRVYAKFECSGTYLNGCNGDFTLTGGSGEKANVSGGGPIQFKSAMADVMRGTPGSMVQQSAVGLAVWPKLAYKLP